MTSVSRIKYITRKLRSNSQIPAFIICLFIAFGIWIANELNQVQHSWVRVPLSYFSMRAGNQKKHDLKSYLVVEISGRGFDLISFLIRNPFKNVEINESKFQAGRDSINAYEILDPFMSAFSPVKMDRITPEWLRIPTGPAYQKKIALTHKCSLNFAPGYMQSGEIKFIPDSIIIYSDEPIDESLSSLYINKKLYNNIKGNISETVGLEIPSSHIFVPVQTQIRWFVPVDRAVEKKIKVLVKADTASLPHAVIIPASVDLTCRVPMHLYRQTVGAQFQIIASTGFNNQDKAVTTLVSAPRWTDQIHWNPVTVDYIMHE